MSEPLDPQKIMDELGYQPLSYDFKTRANRYLSVMGTTSLEIGPTFSLVGKLGFTKYRQKSDVSINLISRSFEDNGSSAVVSMGAVFNTKAQHGFELSLTNIFGEAGALFTTGLYRYRF